MKLICVFYINIVLLSLSIIGCNSPSSINDESSTKIDHDSLLKINSRLYKNQLTGIYYFKFLHRPVEAPPENRFVPILNIEGDSIKDVNESSFKSFFNFYVDTKYLILKTEQYGFYEALARPIDSIPEGCYFENSNYRALENVIQYNPGRGILPCTSEGNILVEYQVNSESEFQVLNVTGDDCAILDGKILVNGCWSTDLMEQDSLLYSKITNAIKTKAFKPKHCY